ncbi:hypothetical protein D3C80_2059160 [compost metagenome]
MEHAVPGNGARMMQDQRDGEGAHIGDAVLIAGDEEAEDEEHHGKHFGAVAFHGHRHEESQADQPVT